MIEVFKTDLADHEMAKATIAIIQREFQAYKITVDLDDCDRILRIQHDDGPVCIGKILSILSHCGYNAELLPDDLPLTGRS